MLKANDIKSSVKTKLQ